MLLERNLRRERIMLEEIYAEMHRAGLDDLGQVRWAILETDGTIAVIPSGSSGTPVKRARTRTMRYN